MSSKKIYNTIGLDEEVWRCIAEIAMAQERSKSFVIQKILEDFCAAKEAEKKNAD